MYKFVLPQTSIDGPAVWTNNGDRLSPPAVDIAWTGTDSAHPLHYMWSHDGVQFRSDVTMSETSIAGPAVLSGGNINDIIAWTGTDPGHRLNLKCVRGCDASLPKLTLPETSFAGPALARFTGLGMVLAWAGTDANHSLNVLPIGMSGSSGHVTWVVGQKTTLWQLSSIAKPSLTSTADLSKLVLSFTQPNGRIAFATSTDGVHWTSPSTSPLPEWSNAAPQMFAATTTPSYYLTWIGVDPAHSLNIQYTTSFPNWPAASAKAVLPESAIGGPSVGYIGRVSLGPSIPEPGPGTEVLVAWTGTDSLHHLNVAVVLVPQLG